MRPCRETPTTLSGFASVPMPTHFSKTTAVSLRKCIDRRVFSRRLAGNIHVFKPVLFLGNCLLIVCWYNLVLGASNTGVAVML